jgi:hypothetical protein
MGELSPIERAVQVAAQARDRRLASDAMRRERGVVHTPPELARYVARSADEVLRSELGIGRGVADPRVALLEPACGPGAFLAAAFATGSERPTRPAACVGVDLDERAIAAAHETLSGPFAAAGWPLTLRAADALADLDPFGCPLPTGTVVAVFGNPPWAGRSANREATTAALLEDFRRDRDGARLDERKIGVLSDDYVRFFRWAAEIVRRADQGIVALVTNASYLDGPVHRGMRGALLRWFDGVRVLDLGGGSLVARRAKVVDESVFGVRPPVAVTFAWRGARTRQRALVRVFHHGVRGRRVDKLALLETLGPSAYRPIAPAAPAFLLCPTATIPAMYHDWIGLDEAMPFHREGIQTNRDAVAIDADPARLLERLHDFAKGRTTTALASALMPSRHYDPAHARRRVAAALESRGAAVVRPVAYRPLDRRHYAAVAPFCHRPRDDLRRATERSELVLLSTRKDRGDRPWRHVGLVSDIADNCYLSNRSSCRTRVFPERDPNGEINIAADVVRDWSDRLGVVVTPIDFVRYVAAVLASDAYREAFDRALRLDYPRIPPPPTADAFALASAAGASLEAAFALEPVAKDSAEEQGVTETSVDVGHFRVASNSLAAAWDRASEAIDPWLTERLAGG